MKFVKIFGAFIVVQCLLWIGSHVFFSTKQSEVLLVVDTSYSMKPNFQSVKSWIENYESSARYKDVVIGTNRASLGPLSELPSKDVIFRTSFGKLSDDDLKRLYSHVQVDKKILLSDGSLSPAGWELVTF